MINKYCIRCGNKSENMKNEFYCLDCSDEIDDSFFKKLFYTLMGVIGYLKFFYLLLTLTIIYGLSDKFLHNSIPNKGLGFAVLVITFVYQLLSVLCTHKMYMFSIDGLVLFGVSRLLAYYELIKMPLKTAAIIYGIPVIIGILFTIIQYENNLVKIEKPQE